MSFSFCYSAVAVISSLTIVINFGLATGGPVVMVWGWLITSFFTMLVGSAMGEICSTYPVAGGVYYWSGVLSNEKYGPIASYICGWFNFVGNCSSCASFAFGFAQMTSGLLSVVYGQGLSIFA